MLENLQVRNYVLIDSLDIDFPAGLIIITGQTGAGKSILLGALSLALGARADAETVGPEGDHCVVEARFSAGKDAALRRLVEEHDLDWDDGRLVLRRVLSRAGRSRAFVNDTPVNLSVLQSLSSRLLDIHSQHQTRLLSDKEFQLSLLDHFAGNGERLAACAAAWSQWRRLSKEYDTVSADLQRLLLEKEFNESLFARLDAAGLREGELEELEQEQSQLSHAEQIREQFYEAASVYAPEEGPGLDASLKEIARSLERAGRFVPSAGELSSRVESCRLELDDILSEADKLSSGIEVDPQRLEAVEERMSLLYGLLKKHGCQTEGELIAVREELNNKLFDVNALEGRKESLSAEKAAAESEYRACAAALHAARAEAAASFSAALLEHLRSLELDRAAFEVRLQEAQPGVTGTDAPLFLFSATGTAPVDVAKCASGGEMSRIMLSLKAMMAQFGTMPTMVFDEIDTGVSGSAADKMGGMICRMGARMQLFAITHLPQVAAKGQAHYVVTKAVEEGSGKAVTRITGITGEDRVREIARMLSGSAITPEAMANARSLMGI